MQSPINRIRSVVPSFRFEGRNGKILAREKNGAIRAMLPSAFKDNIRSEYMHIVSCEFDSARDTLLFTILFEILPFPKEQVLGIRHFLEWLRPIHKGYSWGGSLGFCTSAYDIVLFSSFEFVGASLLYDKQDIDNTLHNLVREGDTLLPLIKSARDGTYVGEGILRFAYGPFQDDIKH